MDQKHIQKQIQRNMSLKNKTWKESGIPTLTQPAQFISTPKTTKSDIKPDYSEEFILDFDHAPLNANGHKIDCTCKNCIKAPRSQEVNVFSSMKADPVKNPLSKRRH